MQTHQLVVDKPQVITLSQTYNIVCLEPAMGVGPRFGQLGLYPADAIGRAPMHLIPDQCEPICAFVMGRSDMLLAEAKGILPVFICSGVAFSLKFPASWPLKGEGVVSGSRPFHLEITLTLTRTA